MEVVSFMIRPLYSGDRISSIHWMESEKVPNSVSMRWWREKYCPFRNRTHPILSHRLDN